MRALENITYDELQVGDYATFTKTLTDEELILFAAASGDINPCSIDPKTLNDTIFNKHIGHGMWAGSIISAALSTVIPGPGVICLEQNLKFNLPVKLGDTLITKLTVVEKLERNRVIFDCEVVNQDLESVVSGQSKVIAPTEKVSMERPELPRIKIEY